ncbi:DUF2087 domain-containing protein [Dubosiella muris]|uniref:DUF2087 domain-containing protein n=2 Tax=Dubosiella TaxID=1937008 RepID=A0AC61R8W3_9FIRM|nr:DUF2087 domain-containing protein [Dubosiella muris]TGY66506.1 DUF2087 domain-containing protein [Dubosiella muris]
MKPTIIEKYFSKKDPKKLLQIPKKRKERLEILAVICSLFEKNTFYPEHTVNQTLRSTYEDFPALRRALVDEKFLLRDPSGHLYWINPDQTISRKKPTSQELASYFDRFFNGQNARKIADLEQCPDFFSPLLQYCISHSLLVWKDGSLWISDSNN